VASLVSRGPSATASALSPLLLASADLAPVDVFWAKCPAEGEVKAGARVVARPGGGTGLVPGDVHQVHEVGEFGSITGRCRLVRCRDGQALLEPSGGAKWVSLAGLALAGAPLGASPLLLACLGGCPLEVVALLLARQPEAAAKVDNMGRTPLALACEVIEGFRTFNASERLLPPFPLPSLLFPPSCH
jgi:hypothetical protein